MKSNIQPISVIMIKNSITNKIKIQIFKIPHPEELPQPPAKWLKNIKI